MSLPATNCLLIKAPDAYHDTPVLLQLFCSVLSNSCV